MAATIHSLLMPFVIFAAPFGFCSADDCKICSRTNPLRDTVSCLLPRVAPFRKATRVPQANTVRIELEATEGMVDKVKSDSPRTFPGSRGCQSVDTLSIRPDERTTAIAVSMIGNP